MRCEDGGWHEHLEQDELVSVDVFEIIHFFLFDSILQAINGSITVECH